MTHYYNAKPSQFGNIGHDVAGAKRMNFNTYESDAEKQARKAANKALKDIGQELKSAILSDSPDYALIIRLYDKQFELKYGFSSDPHVAKPIIARLRSEANDLESIKSFNALIGAYNRVHSDTRGLDSPTYQAYKLEKLRRKYKPKQRPIGEECGATFDWKSITDIDARQSDIDYLAENSNAVQFGNSVTDKERAWIIKSLADFLNAWQSNEILGCVKIRPLQWSFGARGKAGSVAYYDPSKQVISVNRNNIGSLIHELGHYIDHRSGWISNRISTALVKSYRQSLQGAGLSATQLTYYCKREEIFARAFEAYCLEIQAGFSDFAQTGGAFLPELNDELLKLISEALRR